MPNPRRVAQAESQILTWMLEDFRGDPRSIFNSEDNRIVPAGLTAAEVEAAIDALIRENLINTEYLGPMRPYQLTPAGVRRALSHPVVASY